MATAPKGARRRKSASNASSGKLTDKIPAEKTWRVENKQFLDKAIIKDFKDYKENKDFKEHKDGKDFKDHKSEWKDHKDHKFERKEYKIEKIELKENKNEKLEVEVEREWPPHWPNPLGGTPGHPGDPIPDDVILQWAMGPGMGTASHFINPEDRPDLSEGALSGEGDRPKPKS